MKKAHRNTIVGSVYTNKLHLVKTFIEVDLKNHNSIFKIDEDCKKWDVGHIT